MPATAPIAGWNLRVLQILTPRLTSMAGENRLSISVLLAPSLTSYTADERQHGQMGFIRAPIYFGHKKGLHEADLNMLGLTWL